MAHTNPRRGGEPHGAIGAPGAPLIGIAGNLDQFLNMHGVAAKGAGVLLRADRFDEGVLRREVADLLDLRYIRRAQASRGPNPPSQNT